MSTNSSRRQWLKTTTTVLTGIGLAPSLFATERERYRTTGIILLNSNENAYGPSASARKAMTDALVNSNRYPDDQIPLLKEKLAGFWEVGKENILLGAGSSEIIGLTCALVSSSKANIITAEPSYRVWNGQAAAFGLQFKRLPLTADKIHDLNGMLAATDQDTRMIYICNPNNPVGTYVEIDQLKDFANECSKKCVVLIDEAYTEYAGLPSLKDLAIKNKNIIVAKTFSKVYGLAGARVGYAIAHPDTIQKLAAFQPWSDANVSMTSAAAAIAAISDQAFVKDCREKNRQAKEMCYKTFKELSLQYIPSHANFILFNIDKISAAFTQKMQAQNIFVQYREHFGGKWCRLSMGTLEEMQTFSSALKSI
jgi:histidinol-phosphate aminotransferase